MARRKPYLLGNGQIEAIRGSLKGEESKRSEASLSSRASKRDEVPLTNPSPSPFQGEEDTGVHPERVRLINKSLDEVRLK